MDDSDRLQGSRVLGVAGEHFVAQRKAVKRHRQRDANLLAVGAMIAGIAALRLRVGFRQAFEIRARDVVEQHLVINRKQLAAALRQVCLERRLACEKMIERAVEPILVDLLIAKLEQIAKRRAAIPILGNVQLARGLAQPRRNQHGRRWASARCGSLMQKPVEICGERDYEGHSPVNARFSWYRIA